MAHRNPSISKMVLSIILLVGAFQACAVSVPKPTQFTPIQLGPEGSAPITFTRLIIRIPSGSEVGAHHDGILQISKYKHIWLSNITVASDEYKIVASEHLKALGYSILGGDNLLFGKDESAKAEYQLGGTVESLYYNTYAPLAGNYSESNLSITWQVYDVFREQVVFLASTSGFGKQSGIGSACIQAAFLSALDNLLADPKFVNIIKRSPRQAWSEAPKSLSILNINSCKSQNAYMLPRDLESVMQATLIVRAGGTTGSGVLISSDGWALTAAHVVSGLNEVNVQMYSGLELTAKVVRTDNTQDVALLRLPGRGYPCVGLAIEGSNGLGSDLYAIGAPMGDNLAFSITKGVISGFREGQGIRYVQTDAALNPGNSGGPLLSQDGKLVGIVSWKIVARGFEGLAFGVPIKAFVDRLGISWE